MITTRQKLRGVFRDWFNNYLTIERMRENYNDQHQDKPELYVSRRRAFRVITLGKKLHNRRAVELALNKHI